MIPAGTPPALVDIDGLVKVSNSEPLRVSRLAVGAGDHVVIAGLGRAAAELFVHLVTGAAVPDEGTIRIAGRDTRTIATDAEWLASLDRFGLVTDRAVLLDGLTVEANLALPLTMSIDPLPEDVRARVRMLAVDVGLGVDRLSLKVASLAPAERVALHLARALGPQPSLVLLEHPTAALTDRAEILEFGDLLRRVGSTQGVGWLALSNDSAFAEASGGQRLRLDSASGALTVERAPWWRRLFQAEVN